MTTTEARASAHAKKSAPQAPAKIKLSAKSRPAPAAARTETGDEPPSGRVTKHDRVLMLLSERSGTTIPKMMEVTGWQEHSVRGFLAGTVKKKLGFTLISTKAEGELHRYRIGSKRGR